MPGYDDGNVFAALDRLELCEQELGDRQATMPTIADPKRRQPEEREVKALPRETERERSRHCVLRSRP
jgi:hypothetical protein